MDKRASSGKKELGQNFLTDKFISSQIADSIPTGTCEVLEIGPGRGILTEAILARGFKVTAVEIDGEMVSYLKDRFYRSDLEVINADIMDYIKEKHLKVGRYIISNLPFNISSQFMMRMLELIPYPFEPQYEFCGATLMFQKEFARRLTSHSGSKDYSRITVSTSTKMYVEHLMDVGRSSFDPIPEVDASVVVLRAKEDIIPIKDTSVFEKVVERCFMSRRKKMKNLVPGELLKNRGDKVQLIQWMRVRNMDDLRPENMSVEYFVELANQISSMTND